MTVNKIHIPVVEYQPHREPTVGVEVCSLDSIYQRSSTLDYDVYVPHRVQFHHLIYVASGTGSHLIDFTRYPCSVGSFISVSRNQVHAFDRENKPQGSMILFTEEFLESAYASMRLPANVSGFDLLMDSPVQAVVGETRTSCEVLLNEIRKVTGDESHNRIIIQLLLATLLLKLRQNQNKPGKSRMSASRRQQFSRFTKLVEENFESSKDGQSYARKLGVSYKTLSEICKQGAHRTPKQLIDEYTILEAKRRLAIDEVQVTKLAYDLGFNEASNFIKFFKKHTSDTPNQFQRRLEG